MHGLKNLEDVMLSDNNQSQEDKYHEIYLRFLKQSNSQNQRVNRIKMSKLQKSALQYYIYSQQSCIVYLKLMKTDLLLCSYHTRRGQ